jgi:hypothetical protein
MQLFKLFSFQNIILYFSFVIMLVFIFFLSYKYLYLEQSIYLLTNKLNKLEIEYNNPNVYCNEPNSNIMKTAEIIMNEIFTNDNICSVSSNSCDIKTSPIDKFQDDKEPIANKTSIIQPIDSEDIQIVNEIFDLKKDIDDKESIISGTTGGGGLATKKALMKLSLDKLKAKCEDRKLATDGTKNQLADRIIVFDNSIEITDISDE